MENICCGGRGVRLIGDEESQRFARGSPEQWNRLPGHRRELKYTINESEIYIYYTRDTQRLQYRSPCALRLK